MNKNYLMAIICSAIVLIGYTIVQVKFFPAPTQEQIAEQQAQQAAAAGEGGQDALVQEETEQSVKEFSITEADSGEQAVSEEIYTIETDKVKVTFTNRGGDVIGYELTEHFDNKTKKGVEMADNISSLNRAFALSFGGAEKGIVNDLFVVKEFEPEADGTKKIAFAKTYKDFTLIKQYTFIPGEYMFKLNVVVDGDADFAGFNYGTDSGLNAAYSLRTSPQVGPYFDPKVDRYESRSFLSMSEGKGKRKRLGTKEFKQFNKSYNWIGIGGKYFCEIIVPVKSDSMQDAWYSTNIEVSNYANAQAFAVRKSFSDKKVNDQYYIYVGPRSEKELKKYNAADSNKWNLETLRLTECLESNGFFGWIEAILKFFMELIYKFIPNWGVSIIILTIILKLALFPLTMKSSLGTLKMQEIQPKMQAIQEKYKNQPEKLQQETAKLYKESGYNPMSGCLPLVFQMLFLFAMYNLFNNYFEFRGAGFIKGWIDDLSSGDSVYMFKHSIPLIGSHIRVLPLIYLITQFMYGKVTQLGSSMGSQATSGQMKFMTYGLPLMFFFMFYNAPAGLILFWTVSNVIQMGQQVIINKSMAKRKAESNTNNVVKLPPKAKGKGKRK